MTLNVQVYRTDLYWRDEDDWVQVRITRTDVTINDSDFGWLAYPWAGP